MSTHTPGPWFVTEDGTQTAHHFVVTTNEHSDDFEEREDVAEISLPSWTKPNGPRGREDRKHRAEAEANARLIAAAPDLLAACERVIDAMKDHVLIAHSLEGAQTQGREVCALLNAAIAKARGGT